MANNHHSPSLRKLAPRQAEALTYQARGFSYQETAEAMNCSQANIANLLRECFFKLHAANTREAIARAMQAGAIHLCLAITLFVGLTSHTDMLRTPRRPTSTFTRTRRKEDMA